MLYFVLDWLDLKWLIIIQLNIIYLIELDFKELLRNTTVYFILKNHINLMLCNLS